MSEAIVISIGFLAQAMFSARFLVQWLLSEKAQRVLTPTSFWTLSLLGAILLFIYGFLRNDFAIMFGQYLTYYIYVRNLQLQHKWRQYSKYTRWIILGIPIAALLYFLKTFGITFFSTTTISLVQDNVLILGILAHVVFTFRFVYQWIYAERKHKSHLPKMFWYISIFGAALILLYGYLRTDIVLIIAHLFGLGIYFRNLTLLFRNKTSS